MAKNPHAGHRLRTKERFRQEGLDNFEVHGILELLLYYAVPQKNTNLVAHELLDTFGSLAGVFDAPYEDLRNVHGIGEHGATLIKMIPAFSKKYMEDRNDVGIRMLSSTDCGNYVLPKFIGENEELVYLLCLDNKQKVLGCPLVCRGEISSVHFSPRRVVEEAIKFTATAVVLTHNHPRGLALPSSDDISTTRQIYPVLRQIGITLLDHIIVSGDDFISLADSGVFTQFTDRSPAR